MKYLSTAAIIGLLVALTGAHASSTPTHTLVTASHATKNPSSPPGTGHHVTVHENAGPHDAYITVCNRTGCGSM